MNVRRLGCLVRLGRHDWLTESDPWGDVDVLRALRAHPPIRLERPVEVGYLDVTPGAGGGRVGGRMGTPPASRREG